MLSRLKYPKGLRSYVIWFLAVLLVCFGLLCLSMFLPQNRIQNNVLQSMPQLILEGKYPNIYDMLSPSNSLDNFSDCLMLNESFYAFNWENLWNNAYYSDSDTPIEGFENAVLESAPPNTNYSRYWGGFRVPLRLMLTLFDYLEIRHIVSLTFFLLFFLAAFTLYRYSNTASALAFCLSIALVKPEIISNSLQFSCCFLIAFAAMILVVKAGKMGYPQFFLCVGCLTQFFDFYTTPPITWAFPLLVLLAFEAYSAREKWVMAAKTCAAWLSGWLAMWLAKLILSGLFTGEHAFHAALASVRWRLGIEKRPGYEDTYDAVFAIRCCVKTLFHTRALRFILILLFAVFILAAVSRLCRRHPSLSVPKFIQERLVFAAIGLVPFLWFSITASPVVIHYFFQYRTICVSVFAFLLCATLPVKQQTAP